LGAFIDHALFVLMHECTHNLLFNNKKGNKLASLVSNIPQIIPIAALFNRYHLLHHTFQGIYNLDLDLPSRWEAQLIKHSLISKCVWLVFYFIFQPLRLLRLDHTSRFIDGWVVLNWFIQITTATSIYLCLGLKSLVFLLLSFVFSIGLHPLGGRWIQEHYLMHGKQETYSYYGHLNKVAFNVGYHQEHHDFPTIAWNKLPQLKKIAPDFYEKLAYHTSWTAVLFRFLLDKNLSLYCRLVRKGAKDRR
jgi:sphingolipid delta-4 desaturase